MANTTFSQFFPASGASSGGSGGNGLLNQQVFKSSGTFNPSANGILDGGLIHFTMIGGGGGGYPGTTGQNTDSGGLGGRIWSGTIAVPTAATAISITVGAGGASTASGYNGGNSTAIGGGGISISTIASDSRSFFGGSGGRQNLNSSDVGGIAAPTMGFPPFSQGGYLSDGASSYDRGNGTGDGGQSFADTSVGLAGKTGIVIISW